MALQLQEIEVGCCSPSFENGDLSGPVELVDEERPRVVLRRLVAGKVADALKVADELALAREKGRRVAARKKGEEIHVGYASGGGVVIRPCAGSPRRR